MRHPGWSRPHCWFPCHDTEWILLSNEFLYACVGLCQVKLYFCYFSLVFTHLHRLILDLPKLHNKGLSIEWWFCVWYLGSGRNVLPTYSLSHKPLGPGIQQTSPAWTPIPISVILFDSLAFCLREQELGLSPVSVFLVSYANRSNLSPTGLHVKVAGHVIRNAVPKSSPCLLTRLRCVTFKASEGGK